MLRSALKGNAKQYIYLGEEMSIDHAWTKLKEAYGDPQKRTYRWTPEERRRLLDTGTEYEEDVDTSTDNTKLTPQEAFQHPETRPHNIPPDTLDIPHKTTTDIPLNKHPDLGPQNLKTTST